MRSKRRTLISSILVLIGLFALVACVTEKKIHDEKKDQRGTSEKVYLASSLACPASYERMEDLIVTEKGVYYAAIPEPEEGKQEQAGAHQPGNGQVGDSRKWCFYQWAGERNSEPQIVWKEEADREWVLFFKGADETIYSYSWVSGEQSCVITSVENEEEEWEVPPDLLKREDRRKVTAAVRASNGNFYLLAGSGCLYGMNAKGEALGKWEDTAFSDMLLGADGSMYLLEKQEFLTGDGSLNLEKWDGNFENTGEKIRIAAKNPRDGLKCLGACKEGILYGDSRFLYGWNGEEKKILSWDSPQIGFSGGSVQSVIAGEAGSLFVILQEERASRYDFARLTWVDRSKIPDRETITMGVPYPYTGDGMEMVQTFNRTNQKYMIELVYYEDDSYVTSRERMNQDIIKGQGPDLFDLAYLYTDDYAEKGVLEDLEPFFESSDLVHQKDILESVWDSGDREGRMVFVIPSFTLDIPRMLREVAGDRNGVTVEEMMEIHTRYPEADLRTAYGAMDNLEYFLNYNMEKYVNLERKESYFDTEEFINFADWVMNLPRNTGKVVQADGKMMVEYRTEDIYEKKVLVDASYIVSLEDFQRNAGEFGERWTLVGYPTETGELTTGIFPTAVLGMNRAGTNKEGAWAFLEFVLSEDFQRNEVGCLPVRRNLYPEGDLLRLVQAGNYGNSIMTREVFRNIYGIIMEEMLSYVAGDATMEAVAEKIQNRVSLLLNE